MSDLVERLQNWRNKDQADAIVLTRGDIITLLTEIERLHAVARDNQKLAAARGVEIERLKSEIEALRAAQPANDPSSTHEHGARA